MLDTACLAASDARVCVSQRIRRLSTVAPRCRPPLPLPPPGGGCGSWQDLRSTVLGNKSIGRLFASRITSGKLQENDPSLVDLPRSLHGKPLPLHPYLQRRVLPSGLEVFVLPHAHPEGSLEVHLEIHAGSTAEEDAERGMAHLCEHLIFMGNRKRGEVVALQGEANAFTDFHHTVYFVSWRVGANPQEQEMAGRRKDATPSTRKLRVALEMMREVFTAPTQFTAERLLKEKAAVISESSLVNTIFYRKEQAQLSKLHSDTLLPSRFPIGDMSLLRRWSVEDVRGFFARYYRPENAVLYIVGDVAPSATLRAVDEVLGGIRGDKAAEEKWLAVRENWRQSTVKRHSVFFPPLAHAWTRGSSTDEDVRLQANSKPLTANTEASKAGVTDADAAALRKSLGCRLHLWQHPLLQHFSLLFLRKLPIVALRTVGDFFRLLARKLALQALALRLTERCRSADGGWMRVEVADTESVKEGCRIVSVEAEAEQSRWRDAARAAIEEVRQMAEHGLNMQELGSLLDSYRINLDRMHMQLLSSADMLRLLMDGSACGHSLVHVEDERGLALQLTQGKFLGSSDAASSLTGPNEEGRAKPGNMKRLLSLINEEARKMFKWLDVRNIGDKTGGPSAICAFLVHSSNTHSGAVSGGKRVSNTQLQGHIELEQIGGTPGMGGTAAMSPVLADDEKLREADDAFVIPKDAILDELCKAMTRPVPIRQKGIDVPKQLLTSEESEALRKRAERHPPATNQLQVAGPHAQALQLANGVKVTVKPLAEERGSALIRVLIPGGRLASVMQDFRSATKSRAEELRRKSAAMVVGARTMMEGGAVGPFTREQIEAFCQERLIGVSIECLDEFLVIDISTPAFAARDVKSDEEGDQLRMSTLESAMQLLHLIFTAFHFEDSAFRRAKRQTLMDYHAYTRDLVGYSLGELIINMTGSDPRFDALKPAVIEGLELSFTEQQIRSQIKEALARGSVDVTVVGDVDAEHVGRLSAKYLGTIGQHTSSNAKAGNVLSIPAVSGEMQLQSPYLHLQQQVPRIPTQEQSRPKEADDQLSSGAWTKVWGRRLHAYVRDSESRAVVHIGGFACNRWGIHPDGSWIWEHMDALQRRDDAVADRMKGRVWGNRHDAAFYPNSDHRKHPAFPRVALWILQELVTKRLFSILREEQRLTYEAAFEIMSFDILWGGIFVITVHTQPEEAERVLEATHVALQQLTSTRPLLESQLEGAKQQVIGRHLHDRKYARYWLDLLGGLQLPEIPQKTSSYYEDFERVAESVTLQDIHLLLRSLGLRRESMWEAIGASGPVPPAALSRTPNDILEAPAGGRTSTRLGAARVGVASRR